MPNWVFHRLMFRDDGHVEHIVRECCTVGKTLDFERLVPMPVHIYRGNTSAEHEKDFPDNWYPWRIQNWGTKWPAERGEIVTTRDGRSHIEFETAWSVPYPILSALANRFGYPFEHHYYDEMENFWGVEVWDGGADEQIQRTSKRYCDPADLAVIRAEFGVTVDGR